MLDISILFFFSGSLHPDLLPPERGELDRPQRAGLRKPDVQRMQIGCVSGGGGAKCPRGHGENGAGSVTRIAGGAKLS